MTKAELTTIFKGKRYHYGLGRRKTASARVRLYKKGTGQIIINSQPMADYFSNSKPLIQELKTPFVVAGEKVKDYDVSVRVVGGGHHGQVGAIKLGISKALILIDSNLKDSLKKQKMLRRDPRAKERKKFGRKGARKKQQFTKR